MTIYVTFLKEDPEEHLLRDELLQRFKSLLMNADFFSSRAFVMFAVSSWQHSTDSEYTNLSIRYIDELLGLQIIIFFQG